MREFKSVSASQIATYRDCARKWWYQSILGLQTPQNASAALGEAVHAQLEKYLNDGTPPDAEKPAGRIASAGLKFLPPPGTVFTEVSMHGTNRDKKEAGEGEVPLPGAMPRLVVAGMPVNGYIDVLDISADSPVVLDHKTTSDLKWAKTEADLREDVQMVLYGSYALDVVLSMGVDVDTVKAGHIVYLTKGAPLAKRTEVTFTRAMLASERKKLEQTVEEMKVSAKARTPDAVPGEASSCNKFGGCHFKDKCAALGALATIEVPSFVRNANSTTPIPSKETEPMSTVDPLAALAALRAKKAAAAAAAPAVESAAEVLAPPPEAPTSSVAQPTPAAQGAISGASANVLAKYGIKALPAAAAAPAESIVPNDVPSQVKPSFAQPVAQPVAPAPVAAPDEGAKTVRRPKGYAEKLAALNWTEAQIGRMSPDAMRAAIDGSLDGRTHSVTPTGAIHIPNEGKLDTSTIPWKDEDSFENEADAKKFYATFPEEAPKAQPAPVAAPVVKATVTEFAPVAAPVQAAAPTLALYIDCMPEKGREREYTLLEDYIQPMLPLVTEAYNRGCKKDDEKVPFYSLIPYARGPGFVAALVMQQPPTGVIVANTRFPATNAILEVLIPMADVVVRGLR